MEKTEAKTKWMIDPAHTEISFRAKHLMITNVKGVFKEFSADISTAGDDFTTAEIAFRMNPASIDTGDAQRDAHLKSADFFDVETYREVTFAATSFTKAGNNGGFEMTGDLTMRGVTIRITLDAEFEGMMKDPWGNQKAGFTISGKINRREWGLNWNVALEAGGILVSEEVRINCEVQLVRQ
jgi:polyisoprenoid-binding protein YceI